MKINKKSKSYSVGHTKLSKSKYSSNKKGNSRSLNSLSLSLPTFKSEKSFDFDEMGEPSALDSEYKTRKSLTNVSKKSFSPRIWSIVNNSESDDDKDMESDDIISTPKKHTKTKPKIQSDKNKQSKVISKHRVKHVKSNINKAKQKINKMSLDNSLYDDSDYSLYSYSDDYSDNYSESISGNSLKHSKKHSKQKSNLSKKASKQKSSSEDEANIKKEAVNYITNLKKKIALKDKKETYEIIGAEINELEKNADKYINILKLSKINFLLEDIHAKFDSDYEDKVKFNYPTLYDTDFNKKIYQKYEFYKNKIPPQTPESKLINTNDEIFKLSNSQKFLKNFMSPQTPYRSMLIFHGVGVGKTCAAISIVEQFKDELIEEGKKIYVIRDKEIRHQLFDINKVRMGVPELQCTGNTYLDLVNEPKAIEKCESGDLEWCVHLENMVRKTTKKFYDFNGPLQWANKVLSELKKATRNIPSQFKKERRINKIRKMFSDAVLIIDEAHNIKDISEKDKHIIPPVLTEVLAYSKNLRLILLSATPMFDKFNDIIPLINYLLINDKRATIKSSEIFDKEGNFIDGGKDKLIEKTRGYISYLRGEDPVTFPLRFSSAINDDNNILTPDKWPTKDIYGNKINSTIKYLDIIGCPMSSLQYNVYSSYIEKRYKENVMEKTSAAFSSELQISNIVYQGLSQITKDPKECYGERGFSNITEKVEGKTQFRFKNPEVAEIFQMPTIKKYSAKIYEILNSISKAEGTVFVYSQYESSGILPIAFALEMEGYTRYKSKHMPLLDFRNKKPSNGFQYLIISGKENLSKGFAEYLKKGQSMIYEPVKVILGTKAASEGLNFYGIREMHIMEPWHNLNRLEQVVGRGTRKFSHSRLESDKQNLTVYYYAVTTPKNDEETVDMKIYRSAEEKDIKIANIEMVLKQNAIDCNLNKEGNFYTPKNWGDDVQVTTSRGAKKIIKIHDKPYSRICHYQKNCQFKCMPDLNKLKDAEIDHKTYSLKFFQDDIKEIIYIITKMYQFDIVYTLEDIVDYVRQKIELIDINSIYKALDNFIKNKITFKDNLGRKGYLVYQGNYYLFQPTTLDYDKTIYEHRRLPLTIKTNMIDMGNYIQQLRKDRSDLMKKDQYDYTEILDKVTAQVDFILSNDVQSKFKSSVKVTPEEAYSIVLDRLVYQFKNVLLKYLLKKVILDEKLNEHEENIKKQIGANIIYFKDVWDIQNDAIYGYKLIHNDKQMFYVYNQQTGDFEADQGNRNKILEKQLESISQLPEENNIIGYLKFDKKDTPPSFKIRDIQNKDDARNIKGTNCNYKGKTEIYRYIKLLSSELDDIPKTHKNIMCNDIEVLLRRLQKKDIHTKRWFYNAEEYAAIHHEAD
jgi:hypothetical protein